MNTQEIKELLTGAITNLESPRPQQWSPNWISKLKSLETIGEENLRLKKTLQKIVEAGDLWGSEGQQHHEAIYLARCALALTK